MKAKRLIAWLTGFLTLTLALFAFVLSFNSLTDLARQHGFSIPSLFPLIIEFAVVIFSLNALHRSLHGETATWQWALIIGSSLLAGTFNIAHAHADLLSRLMSAMPSLFLLLSFESFLSLIKHGVTRQGVIDGITQLEQVASQKRQELSHLDTEVSRHEQMVANLKSEHDTLQAQLEELQKQKLLVKNGLMCPNDTDQQGEGDTTLDRANDIRQAHIEERREQVLILTEQGMSQSEIADRLAVSLATIKRDVKALNGRMSP